MKRKNWISLSLGLGIISGLLLVDRFLTNIPDWIAIVFSIIASNH